MERIMIQTRQAVQTDAPAISRLLKQMGYEMTVPQVIRRIQSFQKDFHQLWVAEKEEQVVGCIAYCCYEALVVEAKSCHINALVVAQDYRGLGIGKLLMANAEAYAAEQGCTIIDLITSNHRRKSGTHAFYKSLGYLDQEERNYSYFSK